MEKKVKKNSEKSEKMGLAMGWIEKKWKKIVTKKKSEKSGKMGLAKSFNAWLIKLVPR